MAFEHKIEIENLFLIDKLTNQVILKDISLKIPLHAITALIGPARSGKTSLLRCLNRMVDLQDNLYFSGKIYSNHTEITSPSANLYEIRRKFSLVLALPTPLPKSIFENVAIAARMDGKKTKNQVKDLVMSCLEKVGLWNEVKDRINDSAFHLSGGQQQRLCIARALALNPEVILFDEATSGLDPISTGEIEETVIKLKEYTTIIWVTNNVKQASRISDYTGFLLMGELVEFNKTEKLFTNPDNAKTEAYISGKFG